MRRTKNDTDAPAALEDVLDRLLDPLTGLASVGEGGRAVGKATPVLARTMEARGADAFVSVTLKEADLRGGTRPVVRFTVSEPCPACEGTGSGRSGEECGRCLGAGAVETERLLALRIPPGLADGDQVRVRGEGNVPPGGKPGDLYVDVRVSRRSNMTARLFFACGAAVVAFALFVVLRFLV